MKKFFFPGVFVLFTILFACGNVMAHCEIPCGIYNDKMRVDMIAEDVTTIKKAMGEIVRLQGEKSINYNQIVRWITNKDHHANRIQKTVTQYFMIQRIKPEDEKYVEKLTLLHKMLISAMKCKQTTDLSHTENLTKLLQEFEQLYFSHEHK